MGGEAQPQLRFSNGDGADHGRGGARAGTGLVRAGIGAAAALPVVQKNRGEREREGTGALLGEPERVRELQDDD